VEGDGSFPLSMSMSFNQFEFALRLSGRLAGVFRLAWACIFHSMMVAPQYS
jgi:hypothetical protein